MLNLTRVDVAEGVTLFSNLLLMFMNTICSHNKSKWKIWEEPYLWLFDVIFAFAN